MAKEKGRTETVRRMTLAKRAVAELEEKKSIFIGNAAPVRSEDEARAFIFTPYPPDCRTISGSSRVRLSLSGTTIP